MPRLSIENRKKLIKLHEKGISNREISRRLECNEKTVRLTLLKYRNTGKLQDAPKSGRPRATSYREDRAIKVRSLRNRFETANEIRKQCNLVEKC